MRDPDLLWLSTTGRVQAERSLLLRLALRRPRLLLGVAACVVLLGQCADVLDGLGLLP